MPGFTLTEWINCPPEKVFALMHDVERAPDIVQGVQKLEKLGDGPVGVGTRFRETRIVRGQEATTEMEVAVFDPPRRYAVTSETGGIDVTYEYRLTPERGGTHVELECVVIARGLKKVMAPLVAGVMKREDGDHLQQLKRVCER